ncbi:MAG: hypothetical protein ABIG55_01710 [Candidatus Omnitrophota bacterium]
MKYLSIISLSVAFFIIVAVAVPPVGFTADIEMLLKDGKSAIEKGEYEKAVTCLGEILTASGNETDDPGITAFGATVQAYGLIRMNNPQTNQMAIQYLQTAIDKDGEWEYPKKLLKKIGND